MTPHNRYIITGGPGSGKTTLIENLRERGFLCVDESARAVINDQLELKTDLVPWINNAKFSELVLDRVIQKYEALDTSDICFFDRGIADVMAYLILDGIEVPQRFWNAARSLRFNRTVFILPPWEAIYENDSARQESFDLAVNVFETLKKLYIDLEYDVVELPKTTMDGRIKFVLDQIEVPSNTL